ncbi:MAG: hypothetical protein A3B38_00090 [Candidatus Levybacteria bacterium RIFCSPLOWO2_01_FULL_36_13]|nr:MAG: hypothetical protein A2684_01255 [Candidatus Levybacteria bacterium RIFCSPHIGHO2_01_FULL_36_15b]OGH35009.1 MAG: hypothetical protein A3B38_00090 [Candidatus Levybacteria bacterium RIFCSPLOWO2_01_FULL_36_13]
MGIAPSELDQISAPHFEIPVRLTRRKIKEQQKDNGAFLHDLWNERGDITEIRTQKIIASQTDIVAEVILKERYAKGSDFIIKFVEGFPLSEAEGEVKSSSLQLKHGKQKIRNRMLSEEIAKQEEQDGQINGSWVKKAALDGWNSLPLAEKELKLSSYLTRHNKMLINGGEQDLKEKTKDQILWESWHPQLERLVWQAQGMTPEETVIAQREGQIQIWPWIRPSSFTQLTIEEEPSHSNPVLDKLKKYFTSSFWRRGNYPSLPIQLFR